MYNSKLTVQSIIDLAIAKVKEGGASKELALNGSCVGNCLYRKAVFPNYEEALSILATNNLNASELIDARDGLKIWAMNQIVGFRNLQNNPPIVVVVDKIAELEAQLTAVLIQNAELKEIVIAQAVENKAQTKTIADLTNVFKSLNKKTVLVNGVLTKVLVENKVENKSIFR